jgi:hypothetical protein
MALSQIFIHLTKIIVDSTDRRLYAAYYTTNYQPQRAMMHNLEKELPHD